MSTQRVSSEVEINLPLDQVFKFTIDFENIYKWTGAISSKQISHNEFIETYKYHGQAHEVPYIVNFFNENNSWAFTAQMDRYQITGSYTFTKINQNKTRVNFDGIFEINGIFNFSTWFILISSYSTQKQIDKTLQNLKNLLENS